MRLTIIFATLTYSVKHRIATILFGILAALFYLTPIQSVFAACDGFTVNPDPLVTGKSGTFTVNTTAYSRGNTKEYRFKLECSTWPDSLSPKLMPDADGNVSATIDTGA